MGVQIVMFGRYRQYEVYEHLCFAPVRGDHENTQITVKNHRDSRVALGDISWEISRVPIW